VIKKVKPGDEFRSLNGKNCMKQLEESKVVNILPGKCVSKSLINFPKVLARPEFIPNAMVTGIVWLLKATNDTEICHRDVKPNIIIMDETMMSCLRLWHSRVVRRKQGMPGFLGPQRHSYRFLALAQEASWDRRWRLRSGKDEAQPLIDYDYLAKQSVIPESESVRKTSVLNSIYPLTISFCSP
jgi:hypothetical protein